MTVTKKVAPLSEGAIGILGNIKYDSSEENALSLIGTKSGVQS